MVGAEASEDVQARRVGKLKKDVVAAAVPVHELREGLYGRCWDPASRTKRK